MLQARFFRRALQPGDAVNIMWTRLMDLVVLVAQMSRAADRRHVELDKELTSRGYSPDEIGHAVFWLTSRPAMRDAHRPRALARANECMHTYA